MAEKRMFSNKIVGSDAFVSLPTSAQALYFHLGMHADDDGFINNPIAIYRSIGATAEDLNLLLDRKFILANDSGIVVIKGWLINNTIRKDRYIETTYKEFLSELSLDENGSYTMCATKNHKIGNQKPISCNQNPISCNQESISCNQKPISGCIDKNSIDKNSIDKNSKEHKESTCEQVASLYNDICHSYPSVKTLSEARKKAINARLKFYTLDDFKRLFEAAEASDFLKGKNSRNWSANFDWLIKDANMAKVLDGNYQTAEKPKPSFQNFKQRDFDNEQLEREILSN